MDRNPNARMVADITSVRSTICAGSAITSIAYSLAAIAVTQDNIRRSTETIKAAKKL
jgi:hypothetical protein